MIKKNQGFIALTSVLILSAVFLSLSIAVTSKAVTMSANSLAFFERDTAKYQARGCLEYARAQLQKTLDYQGDEVILIGSQECEIVQIEGLGNSDRLLKVRGIKGQHTYLLEDEISSISPKMTIDSSVRVSQF